MHKPLKRDIIYTLQEAKIRCKKEHLKDRSFLKWLDREGIFRAKFGKNDWRVMEEAIVRYEKKQFMLVK